MFDHFRIYPFLGGLAIGAVVLSFYKPQKQEIKKYPHPSDAKDKIFKDKNGICYKYESHEVDCDANEATLTEYPIQD